LISVIALFGSESISEELPRSGGEARGEWWKFKRILQSLTGFSTDDHQSEKHATETVEGRIEAWKQKKEYDEALDLSQLGLKAFPESLRALKKDIKKVYLILNEITEVPQWIEELSELEVISLLGNRLETIPPEIGNLPKLYYLSLGMNRLRMLPGALRQLPLYYLDLDFNPELQIPESILKGRPEEILRYYFESRNDKGKPLLELKLLLVGRGKSGKTTLVKQLAGETPNEYETETHSIAIRELTFNCPRDQVRTRAWDFGGQEILHSTHQFFLTERSLYLLVLEPRTGLAQRDAEYWLKLIETQGGKSPTIVALNWSHGRHWQVDKVKLKRKFPFIVDFMPTDALYGEGI
jgi:internalin A